MIFLQKSFLGKSIDYYQAAQQLHAISDSASALRRTSRVAIAGPRTATAQTPLDSTRSEIAGQALALWIGRKIFPQEFGGSLSILSGGAAGSDQSGEVLAAYLGVPSLTVAPNWKGVRERYGSRSSGAAGNIRNVALSTRATGLIATRPAWHGVNVEASLSPNGFMLSVKLPGVRPFTREVQSPRDIQSIIDELSSSKFSYVDVSGQHVQPKFDREDISDAVELAVAHTSQNSSAISQSEYVQQAKQKWLRASDSDTAGLSEIHQSKSTGTTHMIDHSKEFLPQIIIERPHARGGGRISRILVSIPATNDFGDPFGNKEYVIYSAKTTHQVDTDALKKDLGIDDIPAPKEISERLQKIATFFSGSGTPISGDTSGALRRLFTKSSASYFRIPAFSHWEPNENILKQIDSGLARMITRGGGIDTYGLDGRAGGLSRPISMSGHIPVLASARRQVGKSPSAFGEFTAGVPPEMKITSSPSVSGILGVIPHIAREVIFGGADAHDAGKLLQKVAPDPESTEVASHPETSAEHPDFQKILAEKNWKDEFEKYASAYQFSKFVQDLKGQFSDEQIDAINKKIRQDHIKDIASTDTPMGKLFQGATLSEDGSTINFPHDQAVFKQLEPTISRVMAGNHGIYIESTNPEANFVKPAKYGQYDHYAKDGRKYYFQKTSVNYADYVPGNYYCGINEYSIPSSRQPSTTLARLKTSDKDSDENWWRPASRETTQKSFFAFAIWPKNKMGPFVA